MIGIHNTMAVPTAALRAFLFAKVSVMKSKLTKVPNDVNRIWYIVDRR